ncbi:discoidin domain-containing protein [Stieleria sp. ICT_E10.1]|nr:discoidin domain-containing protein [Stieleria sedimenti]
MKPFFIAATLIFATISAAEAQVLDKRQQLQNEAWWYNRDFDWYEKNIPFFECPDREITTTYYYRWDLLTKHLTYGSPNTGYIFTEFIDRPFWSGAYGAISCPAGHQLYEARWLRTPRVANDYSRYWLRTPGAQPRNYSNWLADSAWAVHQVHPDEEFLADLLDDLVKNFEGWEQRHFVPEVGLFWQTGHDDGMEFNINSRQTRDILRGAPSYRPSFNAYMWADAQAITRIAVLANRRDVAKRFTEKADALKAKMLEMMWDERRQFFFPVLKNDEERDGYKMKALTRTYESGQHAGDPHGRELIGYVPWQFNLLSGSTKYDVAWKKLMDRDGFYADFGPSTVERNDPMFLLKKSCCWWSGQSWPYATTQTLKALANSLQSGSKALTNADYTKLLGIYARSHRKNGKPYLAEALHPDTGSFEGHDGYNHSEHYLHSGYCDLVITGLAGLVPRDDDTLEVRPLAPTDWGYFALDTVPYRGHLISVVWDKRGDRYKLGKGLHLLVDGQRVGGADKLQPVVVKEAVPVKPEGRTSAADRTAPVATNFAVNNDGTYFPRITASYTAPNTSLSKLNDGNYWYLLHPPNRWTCQGSPNLEDWITVAFGTPRTIHTVKVYVLDDSDLPESPITAPQAIRLESWMDGNWKSVDYETTSDRIVGHRPYTLTFGPLKTQKLRAILVHSSSGRSGLTEIEAWGDVPLPLESRPHPPGNLAFNDGRREFPKATASYHDRFGGVPESAIDGKTNFLPTPTNRWTSYESPNHVDWLQIEFGKSVEFNRIELAIYDDRGGVQRPVKYDFEIRKDDNWLPITDAKRSPEEPAGSQWNSATFARIKTSSLRIRFTNRGRARSGVTEVMVWNDEQRE